MKVFIIEDETQLAKVLQNIFWEKLICEFALSFSEAIEKIETFQYDFILLDVMLPRQQWTGYFRELQDRINKIG